MKPGRTTRRIRLPIVTGGSRARGIPVGASTRSSPSSNACGTSTVTPGRRPGRKPGLQPATPGIGWSGPYPATRTATEGSSCHACRATRSPGKHLGHLRPAHTGCSLCRRHAGPPGPLEAQRRLDQDAVSKVFASLALEGRGSRPTSSASTTPFSSCQSDRQSPDRADGGGRQDHPLRRRGPDLLPGGALASATASSAADWRSSRTGGGTS